MHVQTMFKSVLIGATAALLFATSAQAALLDRDMSGNAVASNSASAVFLYDTDLNITWLRDANFSKTTGFNANGQMNWERANRDWLHSLNDGGGVYGYTNWRLPTSQQPDSGCSSPFDAGFSGLQGIGYNCTGSEMGHLWFVELGNVAASPIVNKGDFQNLLDPAYWTGTAYSPQRGVHWYFDMSRGFQNADGDDLNLSGMAVRDGDVLLTVTPPNDVPEPGTLLLTAAALLGLGMARRRRSLNQASA